MSWRKPGTGEAPADEHQGHETTPTANKELAHSLQTTGNPAIRQRAADVLGTVLTLGTEEATTGDTGR